MSKPSREYIYGINPAAEVLRAGRRKVYAAHIGRDHPLRGRQAELVATLAAKGIPLEPVDRSRLIELAGSHEHQGIVLKTSPYPYEPLENQWSAQRLLVLDHVEDPHNVGAILRCAEVFGIQRILFPEKGVPAIYPSIVKFAAGATEFLHISRAGTPTQLAARLREHAFEVLALDAAGDLSLREAAAHSWPRWALVIGGEDKGVSPDILAYAHRVAIPMRGRLNSLNAAVAAGIALHTLTAQP